MVVVVAGPGLELQSKKKRKEKKNEAGHWTVSLKPEIRDDIYQAFAVLGSSGPTRTLELYKAWVSRLAATEFADELVVLATALWLKVRIVIVPWNDPLQSTWKISTYPPPQKRTNMWPTVYLGNDDVHYVWLKRR